MTPTLKDELGLDAVCVQLDEILSRIDKQETEKPAKKGPITPLPDYTPSLVDSKIGVSEMVDAIHSLYSFNRDRDTTIFLDLEGYNLGRDGTLALMQIYVPGTSIVYILDVHNLGAAAFDTPGIRTDSTTLRQILEADCIRTAFWDCRADSDALFAHYGIRLNSTSVDDVQLLDAATTTRYQDRKKLKGLRRVVESRIHVPRAQLEGWIATKEEGFLLVREGPNWKEKQEQDIAECKRRQKLSVEGNTTVKLMTPEDCVDDGWREKTAWEQRPLPQAMLGYAAGDVVVLPILLDHFLEHATLSEARKNAVRVETVKRISKSHAAVKIEGSADSPKGWAASNWCEEPSWINSLN